MLTLRCTQCSQVLQVADDAAGKRCKCGKCGAILDVPRQWATSQIGAARAPAGKPEQTLPPSQPAAAPAGGVDLASYLAPPQGPGEIGRIGVYRVIRLLGAGGMGVVLQAEDTRLHRAVALKIMQPGLAAVNEHRERFLQEARIAAAVEHDNIITIFQVDEERGLPFIAMQMLRGETLEARLQKHPGPQPIPFVLRVGREIAAGLEAAHQANLIHRDIKPANIWLEAGRDRVKILDFGLARVIHAGSQMTQAGVVLGTPGYLAPEQVGGQPVSTACDRFSLGAVLYRMCTGTLPFKGTDVLSLLAALATTTPRPVREVNPAIPPRLADLITRMLSRDPIARPSDAEVVELLRILEAPSALPVEVPSPTDILNGATEISDGLTGVLPAPKKKLRVGALIAAAGVAGFFGLILLIGLAFLVIRGGGSKPEPQTAAQTSELEKKEPTKTEPALAWVHDSVRNKRIDRTSIVGLRVHQEFEEIPPEGGILVGFEVGIGKAVFRKEEISPGLRPIFLTEKGEVTGALRGKQGERTVVVKAKPGYAVGAIDLQFNAFDGIESFRLTFMRIDKDGLQQDQSYQSDWIVGNGQKAQFLTGKGAFIVGIHGRQGIQCFALGLVTTSIQK
jgi:serine/threonine protein kinase/phage FluMu protein Com